MSRGQEFLLGLARATTHGEHMGLENELLRINSRLQKEKAHIIRVIGLKIEPF